MFIGWIGWKVDEGGWKNKLWNQYSWGSWTFDRFAILPTHHYFKSSVISKTNCFTSRRRWYNQTWRSSKKIWNDLLLFLDSNLRSWKFTGYTTSEWFILPLIKYLDQNMTTDLFELYILSTCFFALSFFVTNTILVGRKWFWSD